MSLIERLKTKWREKEQQKQQAAVVQARIQEAALRAGAAIGGSNPSMPVIKTPWGDVTESARRQAAINMAADPAKRAEVEAFLAKRLGSVAAGLAEAQRAYPEAYQSDEVAQ